MPYLCVAKVVDLCPRWLEGRRTTAAAMNMSQLGLLTRDLA